MLVREVLSYLGPNRRSERTVVEWKIELSADEQQRLEEQSRKDYSSLRRLLRDSRYTPLAALAEEAFPRVVEVQGEKSGWQQSLLACFLEIVARLALAIQRCGGHRVSFHTLASCISPDCMRMIYESEHPEVAISAGELAFRLCSEAVPDLQWQPDPTLPGSRFSDGIDSFLGHAGEMLLPLDTEAIIKAAARHDVPCVKLEREPYAGLKGDFRICRNGLLRLGHSCHQQIVDGTLCLERNAAWVPMLFDRNEVYKVLAALRVPRARQDKHLRQLVTAKRAARAAERVGFPVIMKPLVRNPSDDRFMRLAKSVSLNSAVEVRQAFEQLPYAQRGVIVEQYLPGEPIHLLLAGHKLMYAAVGPNLAAPAAPLHASLVELAESVATRLDVGLLHITLVSTDPSRPLNETGGAVVDLNPAPNVHALLESSRELIDGIFEAYLEWLFPAGANGRIPLLAVTGTNGKTTTSKMIASIMQAAGYRTGLASTVGVYKNHRLQVEGDQSGISGHHQVFESREVDLAVLETARGGIASSGFMFDHCDVAVCLNVSPDHLGEYGVNTLADMARIKRSVLERARQAVVINADYQACLDMLPFAGQLNIYAASIARSAAELRASVNGLDWLCVCEPIAGVEWIVLHGPAGERFEIVPVDQIPATFKGTARFNISNAQHAICASHALGVSLDHIRNVLGNFDSSFENNPGRMNVYRGLPFTVVMDYAHNEDGLARVGQFLESQQISGKKILLYAVTGNRTVEALKTYSLIPLHMFDHFVCRGYPGRRGARHPEFPGLMKQALMEAGVSEDRITVVDVPEEGPAVALGMAAPGDLVMLCPGTLELATFWNQVLAFKPEKST